MVVLVLASLALALPSFAAPIRAAYFYHYMTAGHVDSLASAGFNRAVIRLVGDSVDAQQSDRLNAFATRGHARGVLVVPDLLYQSKTRLESLGSRRRYTWGVGRVEASVACPLDTAYWNSAFVDHAEEVLAAVPGVRSVAFDFELYGADRKHYDAGACRCPACLAEYSGLPEGHTSPADAWKLSGLLAFQESTLSARLVPILRRFADRHPGIEVGVLDLDFDSFVHRALARALDRAGIPTVDYSERSYHLGGGTLAGARARLDALGFHEALLVGGLWLQRWTPHQIAAGVRSVVQRADGYFVFTTYSLWLDPNRLTGPYTLQGPPADYWRVFREVNRAP